jgi:hypothetical protein
MVFAPGLDLLPQRRASLGSPGFMTVIKLDKPRKGQRVKRDLVPIHEKSGPARFFRKMVADVESDLGGRRHLSRIESELIRGFCGSATLLQTRNLAIALGDASEVDVTAYATLASTMLRIGSRLGLHRVAREVPSLDQYLKLRQEEEHGTDAEAETLDDNNPSRGGSDET